MHSVKAGLRNVALGTWTCWVASPFAGAFICKDVVTDSLEKPHQWLDLRYCAPGPHIEELERVAHEGNVLSRPLTGGRTLFPV